MRYQIKDSSLAFMFRQFVLCILLVFIVFFTHACHSKKFNKVKHIQFRNIKVNDKGWVSLSGDKRATDIELDVSLLYADDRRFFLYGNFTSPAITLRSVLLMSKDGGMNWKETLEPVFGNSTVELFFVDKDIGFALNMWEIEGPGELTLYRTNDRGESWKEVSRVDKLNNLDMPLAMGFVDQDKGYIVFEKGLSDAKETYFLVTKDGGKKWSLYESQKAPLLRQNKLRRLRLSKGGGKIRLFQFSGNKESEQKLKSEVFSLSREYRYYNGVIIPR